MIYKIHERIVGINMRDERTIKLLCARRKFWILWMELIFKILSYWDGKFQKISFPYNLKQVFGLHQFIMLNPNQMNTLVTRKPF
ncbi:hypothetical protein CWB60_05605 [Pseudoalteromonas sp. S327]|nr:hypothetical protein CWB60_05605 [Pseudoalteromonas sp. S327]TMO20238.1 hypothetical protein CWB59_00240 [Pseudoalteromonas sp. S326]HAG40595.1 hypothetical protein [Pseudoalteromonas sp.]